MLEALLSQEVITGFGRQWIRYPVNTGFYGSREALENLLRPLLDPAEIAGRRVADVGAGSGRYVRLLQALGAREILAVEPSDAIEVLQRNTADLDHVTCLHETADRIPKGSFDLVLCVGVLQFIPDPRPALRAMGQALGPGGRLFLWVYGKENNLLYLALLRPLRLITSHLPPGVLDVLARFLELPARVYARGCRSLNLPLSRYMREYFGRMDRYARRLIIYDQLSPKYVRYYRGEELKALLETCGFVDVLLHHRLGHSWSALASYSGRESP